MAERFVLCTDGVKLAVQHWKTDPIESTALLPVNFVPSERTILCVHGWLDNAASFNLLAPALLEKGAAKQVIALDFPGHGLSDHKSNDAHPQLLAEYAYYIAEATKQIIPNPNEKFTLIGHSMGAGVASIFAAAWPDKIDKLILLDGLGPQAQNARDASSHARASIEKRFTANKILYPQFSTVEPSSSELSREFEMLRDLKGKRVYPNVEKALETRMLTARLSPGKQSISLEAAAAMVKRSTQPAPEEYQSTGEEVVFQHDIRLNCPSLQYYTKEQVQSLLEDITCQTCVVLAEDGWPISKSDKEFATSALKPYTMKTLPGSHHFHSDPDTAEAVIDYVADFLLR